MPEGEPKVTLDVDRYRYPAIAAIIGLPLMGIITQTSMNLYDGKVWNDGMTFLDYENFGIADWAIVGSVILCAIAFAVYAAVPSKKRIVTPVKKEVTVGVPSWQ